MAEKTKELPQRTCITCRHEGAKDELLRFVLGPDNIVAPDLASRLPGRGAYTCFDPRCIHEAVRRRSFARAFKHEVVLPASSEFVDEVKRLVMLRLVSLLAMANKAGVVVSGGDSVERALSSPLPGGIVWIAVDVSPDRLQKYAFLASRAGCAVYVGCSSAELGGLLGKELRTFLLLRPSGMTVKLKNEIERFRKIIDGGAQEQ